MPKLSPQEIVDKQIRNAGAAVEDVVKGIERLTVTPGEMAKKKKEKYRQAVLKSLDDGTWDAGMSSYTLQQFKDAAIPKVRERYASGVAASAAKSLAARIQLSAHQDTIQKMVAGMPDDTEQQREQRMLTNLREMRKFKLSKSRR